MWEIPAAPGCKGSVSVKWDGPQRRLAPNHIESRDEKGIKNREVFFLKWDFGNNFKSVYPNVGAKPFIIVSFPFAAKKRKIPLVDKSVRLIYHPF